MEYYEISVEWCVVYVQTVRCIEYKLIRAYAFGYIIALVGRFVLICYGQGVWI